MTQLQAILFLELLGLAMKLYIFAERRFADKSMSGWHVLIRLIVCRISETIKRIKTCHPLIDLSANLLSANIYNFIANPSSSRNKYRPVSWRYALVSYFDSQK